MKRSFLLNTTALFAAMAISKLLGAVFKIPLGNILGGEGMGIFTAAYSIFTPVLSFACAGIPTVLTRTAANLSAKGDTTGLGKARRCSLIPALILGAAGAVLICAAALPFTCVILDSPECLPGVLMIAPATLFCSVTAVYRGYYEGLSDTVPTAVSQVIEAAVKAALGVGMAYIVYANGKYLFGSEEAAVPYSAAAAVLAVTVSELCGMIYMLFRARSNRAVHPENRMTPRETYDMCRDIFMKALPISLGAAAANLLSLADMLTISNCVDLSASLFGNSTYSGNFMYGCYAGIVMSVYLPAASASGVVSRCMMPRLAASAGTLDANRNIRLLMKGTAAITAPLTMFTAVLAGPLLNLLYPVRETEASVGTAALTVLCAGGILPSLASAVCVIFNAYGDFGTPVKIMLAGGALKVVFNVIFMINPFLDITGASISAVLSGGCMLVFSLRAARRRHGLPSGMIKCCMTPVLAAAASSVGVYLFGSALLPASGLLISVLVSMALGALMYALMLFIADSEDCAAVIKALKRALPDVERKHL